MRILIGLGLRVRNILINSLVLTLRRNRSCGTRYKLMFVIVVRTTVLLLLTRRSDGGVQCIARFVRTICYDNGRLC